MKSEFRRAEPGSFSPQTPLLRFTTATHVCLVLQLPFVSPAGCTKPTELKTWNSKFCWGGKESPVLSGPKPPLYTGPSALPHLWSQAFCLPWYSHLSPFPGLLYAQVFASRQPLHSRLLKGHLCRDACLDFSFLPSKTTSYPQVMHNLDSSLPGTQHDIITCLSVMIN